MTELEFDQAVQEELLKYIDKLQNVQNKATIEIKHAQEKQVKQKKQIDQKLLMKRKEFKRPFKIGAMPKCSNYEHQAPGVKKSLTDGLIYSWYTRSINEEHTD